MTYHYAIGSQVGLKFGNFSIFENRILVHWPISLNHNFLFTVARLFTF